MERLSAAEFNQVMLALMDRVTLAWEQAASNYQLGTPEPGDYWARVCRITQSAYATLMAFPYEPEEDQPLETTTA